MGSGCQGRDATKTRWNSASRWLESRSERDGEVELRRLGCGGSGEY
jgi:hypothetical protein